MRVYVAGPMTGLPEFNYPAFNAAAAAWRAKGYQVENPTENFRGETGLAYEAYITAGLAQVLRSDAIALLPGWEHSRGALLEIAVARTLGFPFYDAETFQIIEVPRVEVSLRARTPGGRAS